MHKQDLLFDLQDIKLKKTILLIIYTRYKMKNTKLFFYIYR